MRESAAVSAKLNGASSPFSSKMLLLREIARTFVLPNYRLPRIETTMLHNLMSLEDVKPIK